MPSVWRRAARNILTAATPETVGAQPAFYQDLQACFGFAWKKLEAAPKRRTEPFRTPTLATVDANGQPQQRVMVLRDVDRGANRLPRLRFHSDVRAPKCAQLSTRPACSVLFYDKVEKVQVRANGLSEVCILADGAGSASALHAWRASSPVEMFMVPNIERMHVTTA